MDRRRRQVVKTTGGAAIAAWAISAGLVKPSLLYATERSDAAFRAKTIADTVKALGGAAPIESREIELTVPEIAENGAVVPVTVSSRLAKTQSIALLVEKNPTALAAVFDIPDATDPYIVTRIKMAQTSHVTALVKADGKYFFAAREIKVTLGGCGG